ncbi:MAG TPA: LptF/LptG family permease [Verrucomicrobiae bacterium]|nr:LptF/LptG family permease [Verrucomicrobiae bacterium]
MRLLDRYLLRELLMPLVYCLVGIQAFVTFFILFTDLDKIQESKLHFLDTIEYSTLSAMGNLTIVLPISLLLALLIALTYHARHNEITAMRAAGMSLWRLCVPYVVVGFGASLVLFALNEIGVPRSTAWAEQILNRYVRKADDAPNQFHGFVNAHANRIWIFNEYRPRTAEMSGSIVVNWTLPDGSIRKLYADRAIYSKPGWTFFNAREFEQAGETAPVVPLLQTNELAMPDFDETPAGIENEIKMSEYESLHSRKLNVPLSTLWEYLRRHPNLPPAEAANWWTKFYGRLAAPWTCLVVVLIAIPFGVASGRRNLFVGVAGSVFICFTFFVLQQVGLALGTGGYLPAWLAAWLPNLIFATTGLLLTARVR